MTNSFKFKILIIRSENSGPEDLIFKTYGDNFHAHYSCVRKQEKVVWVLSFDHLRIWINTVFRHSYVKWIFPLFLDKIK